MRTPKWILSIALTAVIGLQTWTVRSIMDLNVKVATLSQRVDDAIPHAPIRLSSNPSPNYP